MLPDKVCTHAEWNLLTQAMDIDKSNDEFESQTKLVKEGGDFSLIELPTVQEQAKTHLRPTKTAEDVLPKGVTFRPSGKWQVQLFYAGQSRYLGMFPSKESAAMAYELAHDCAIQLGDDDWKTWKKLSTEQVKANISTLRKAAAGALMTTDTTQQQAIRVHRIVPKKSEEKSPVVMVDDAFLLLYFASHSVHKGTRVDVTSA